MSKVKSLPKHRSEPYTVSEWLPCGGNVRYTEYALTKAQLNEKLAIEATKWLTWKPADEVSSSTHIGYAGRYLQYIEHRMRDFLAELWSPGLEDEIDKALAVLTKRETT